MCKLFTDSDLQPWANGRGLFADQTELIYAPLDWQKQGLSYTATGYGAKDMARLKRGQKRTVSLVRWLSL